MFGAPRQSRCAPRYSDRLLTRRLLKEAHLLVVALLLLPACASRGVSPDAGRTLWSEAGKEEEALLARVKVYNDPSLADYLSRITDRWLPGTAVVVLQDPTLNAFAMPNGRIYLHTGLLSRVDNEAQLATILAHELTHNADRHALGSTRAADRTRVVGGVFSPTAGAILGLGLRLAATAAITGYGHDREREADAASLKRLVTAGYDPKEAPEVYRLLARGADEGGPLERFLLGNPAHLQERIATTEELLRRGYTQAGPAFAGLRNTDGFVSRRRVVVRDNAALDIRAGRFELAREQLDRALAVTPDDPIAELYYGDLYRLRSQQVPAAQNDDVGRAVQRYERAAALDPTYADPFRQLGFLYYQQKDAAKAREAFARYLVLAPAAPDARRIREYLAALDR